MAAVDNFSIYKLYEVRNALRTVRSNEVHTPVEYKKCLDLLYKCYKIVNEFMKFAEKQMTPKFETMSFMVIL